jgi:hypothetical protein
MLKMCLYIVGKFCAFICFHYLEFIDNFHRNKEEHWALFAHITEVFIYLTRKYE